MAHLAADLLAILRCPVTGAPLVQEGTELVSTDKSGAETPRYSIEAGIPVLLPAQLLAAAAAAGSDQHDGHPSTDSPQK